MQSALSTGDAKSRCCRRSAKSMRYSTRFRIGSYPPRQINAFNTHRNLSGTEAMRRMLAILILAFCGTHALADQPLPELALEINGHRLTAEVAANDTARATGLKHRRMIPTNQHMLLT